MSSILKALKKVEDKNTGNKAGNPWQQKSADRKAAQKYAKPPRRSSPLLLAVAAVILLVSVVWYSAPRQNVPVIAPASENEARTSQQDQTPAPAVLEETPGKTPTADSSAKSTVPAQPTATDDLPAKIEPVAIPPKSREKEVVESPMPEAPTINKVLPVNPVMPAPVISKQSPQALLLPDMELLDSSILKLQAITWSASPESRFSLINNRIVRRGESIGGFTLVRIEEDYVVVKLGQQYWKLEFRIR